MYAERGEGLCCALAEADITDAGRLGIIENILYGVRDIVPSEIVDAEVPELRGTGFVMKGFLGIFIAAIVPQPNVKSCNKASG